ncbi:hypothetical protein BN132_693 [Cronobacter turicensis 564]|nr:hypothetical protein BN132_693 [Cronobacter turicensis 564]
MTFDRLDKLTANKVSITLFKANESTRLTGVSIFHGKFLSVATIG